MDSAPTIDERYNGKKYDILHNGTNAFLVHYIFNPNADGTTGTISCNQTMFDKDPYTVVNDKDFKLGRKNGSEVLWRWSSPTEAFRVDKPIFSFRLAKV